MALVAWILAVFGAELAFALCAGSASGLVRKIDRASAIAVMPLPALAMYFTASDLYALGQAGPPYNRLVFVGGPFVIGLVTLAGVVLATRNSEQARGSDVRTRTRSIVAPLDGSRPMRHVEPLVPPQFSTNLPFEESVS